MESMKAKAISQRVDDDATPCSLVGLVSIRISSDVTLSGDHISG